MDKTVMDKLEAFFTKFKNQTYKKGEILIRADDDPSGVFYLKEGHVRQYAISKKGDELVLNIFKPISFFPMNWTINNTPNAYYYEAMTEAEIWRAPKEETLKFIKDNPDVLLNLLSRVYKGIDGMLDRMAYLMTGNAYERLIMELLVQAKRFGGKPASNAPARHASQVEAGGNSPNLEIKVSEKDLATQAGITRETVSRELKRLKDKRLVSLNKGTLIINDLNKLEEELSSL